MPSLIPSWSDLHPFLPELVLLATISIVLLIPVFSPRKNNLAVGVAAAFGVFIAILALLTIHITATGISPGSSYFNAMLIMDPFAWFFKLAIFIFVLLVIALWAFTTRDTMGPGDGPEFFTLLLSATTGMALMGSTTNLLMIFLAVEMASLPSYILAGFRKTHRPGAEAALKYVVFGAVTSAVMLFGMSLLYGLTGSLDIATLAQAGIQSPATSAVVILGLVGILVGIGFKIAMVPMHFWAPDVFEGTHIDVAAFLSVASKAAGLTLLLRIVLAVTSTTTLAGAATNAWLSPTLLILGGITCFWGNLAAYAQNNIKRLLAYSSIAHAGYMLLGISVALGDSRLRSVEALLFYLFMYLFMNAGAFIAAAAIAQRLGTEDIRQYAGLGRRSMILALTMTVFLFSLIGIPPMIGFGAKLKLFIVLMQAHSTVGYIAIAILGVNTILAAFYYFRIIKAMWLTPSEAPAVSEFTPTTLLAALLVLPNIFFLIFYGWVDDQTHTFAQVHIVQVHPSSHSPTPATKP